MFIDYLLIFINYLLIRSSRTADAQDDIKTVRAALFDVIKFYVKRNIRTEELQALLIFIHSVNNDTVVSVSVVILW